MIEVFLGGLIWGSFIWFVILTSILFLMFFVAEYNEFGWAAFISVLVYGGIFWLWGTADFDLIFSIITWKTIVIYFLIGFLYSIIRSLSLGIEIKKDWKSFRENYSHYNKPKIKIEETESSFRKRVSEWEKETADSEQETLNGLLKSLQGQIFRWLTIWPVSAIWWILTKFKFIGIFVWEKFGIIWKSIAIYGFNSID